MESANVCLIRATATGVEILKNLVLPSIGSFTVLDDALVSDEDLGRNFFVSLEYHGKSRAECVTALLKELNEDVKGHFVNDKSYEWYIENNLAFFAQFSLVIVGELVAEHLIVKLEAFCRQHGIVLVFCYTVGFIGYLRISSEEFPIVETHPENVVDLRLDCPWPELVQYCKQFHLKQMEKIDLSHTPYVALLVNVLDEWKAAHGGSAPTYKDRQEFKQLLASYSPTPDEENFQEAMSQAYRVFSATTIPSHIKQLFEDESCVNLNSKTSSNFWFLVRALKEFVLHEGEGKLPLIGAVPDMKADTSRYVDLQHVYRRKSLVDKEHFVKHLNKILLEHGRPAIPETEIDIFCKNTPYLRLLRYRTIKDEVEQPKTSFISSELDSDDNREMLWYIVLRAAQNYKEEHGSYPGKF